MSAISQKIPNLFGGISQQPDTKKVPGQVRRLVNGYPEFALGLIKRPGAKFEADLVDNAVQSNAPEGVMFDILRDDDEKYIVQYYTETILVSGSTNVTVPNFKIWRLRDGVEVPVDRSLLLTHTPSNNAMLRPSLDTTGTAPVGSLKEAIDKWVEYVDEVQEGTNNLAQETADYISTNATYRQTTNAATAQQVQSFNVSSTYDHGNVNTWLVDGKAVHIASNTEYWYQGGTVTSSAPSNVTQGNERTDEVPQLAQYGYRFYAIVVTTPGSGTPSTPGTWNNKFLGPRHYKALAGKKYKEFTDLWNAYNSGTGALGTNWSGTHSTYLTATDVKNVEWLTDNDVTYLLNKEKVVTYQSGTSSPTGIANSALVELRTFQQAQNYTFKVYYSDLDGSNAGNHGAANYSATTSQTVENLYAAIETGHGGQTANYTLTRSNNTYLVQPASGKKIVKVEVAGPGLDYITAIQDEIDTVAFLPQHAFHGYIVKVVNTVEIDVDDMYVMYKVSDTASNGDSGEGVWVETVAPAIDYKLDGTTLPHKLRRNSRGFFEVLPSTWEDRRVGDKTTNPDPAFIGKNINGMFLYRNRFCVLTGSKVQTSRANKYYDFFAKSALTVGDDDPVNVTALSTQPVDLSYVAQTSVGVLLFGTTEQFLMTTNNDIFGPKTTQINTISKYKVATRLEAKSMGTSTVFFSKTNNYLTSFEFVGISNTTAPTAFEHTQVVPELLPATIDSVATSPPKSIISFGQKGTETLYQYRFLRVGERELATAWYQWSLPGKLVHQFFDDRELYAVVQDTLGKCYVVSYNLNQANKNGYLSAENSFSFDPCLDLWTLNPPSEYDSSSDKTIFHLPYSKEWSNKPFYCVILNTANQQLLSGQSAYFYAEQDETTAGITIQNMGNPADNTVGNVKFELPGDIRGTDIIFGLKYTMEVELPTIFLQDQSGGDVSTNYDLDLIIKQLKVLNGPSGPISYKVDIQGITSNTFTKVNTDIGDYNYNALNVSLSDTKTVPVYQRNKNVSITAIGDSPLPVNLLSITWEGRATSKYYRRV